MIPKDKYKLSKYHAKVLALKETPEGYEEVWVWVDSYMVQKAIGITGRIAHAWKKLWNPGLRSGGKSLEDDLEESIWSLQEELRDVRAAKRLS